MVSNINGIANISQKTYKPIVYFEAVAYLLRHSTVRCNVVKNEIDSDSLKSPLGIWVINRGHTRSLGVTTKPSSECLISRISAVVDNDSSSGNMLRRPVSFSPLSISLSNIIPFIAFYHGLPIKYSQ